MHDEGFFDGLPFFRVIPGFLIQFGISPDVTKHRKLQALGNVPDDERHDEAPDFEDGIVSFAGYGPDSRSTHLFITLGDQPGGLTFGSSCSQLGAQSVGGASRQGRQRHERRAQHLPRLRRPRRSGSAAPLLPILSSRAVDMFARSPALSQAKLDPLHSSAA
eukprot:491973-Prymnesium_polylepis.1